VKTGFLEISAKDYHADKIGEIPTLNHGCAVTLAAKSPEHAWQEHPRFGAQDREATPEMEFGDIVHQLILGKGAGIAVFEGDSWRGKDASAFWDRAVAQGLSPVKLPTFKLAEACANAFAAKLANFPDLAAKFAAGKSEQVMVWNDGDTWLRSMIDRLFIDENAHKAVIFDVKTCQDAREHAAAGKIHSMGYDVQCVQYSDGLARLRPDLAGRIQFLFLFIETKPPFGFAPYELDGEYRAIGASRFARAVALWSECLKQNRWPVLASEVVKLTPKSWELTAEFGEESLTDKMERP
jgi:PDDEXK-like domain of unknown function (DUF3799)